MCAGAERPGKTAAARFERVRVSRNTAGKDGGGVNLYRTHGVVRESNFTANTAVEYGGAVSQDCQGENKKDFLVENSKFTSNEADAGGAVQFKQDAATIRGCAFTGNTAKDTGAFSQAGRGGALYKANGARLDLTGSTFEANHAEERGGAIYATGSNGNPTQGAYVEGCSFKENTADDGGAALASWLEAWLVNASSFVDNVDNSNDAGLMRLQKGHTWVRKCTFTTAQNLVDFTTAGSTLNVYCSPTLTEDLVDKCGSCDATYDDDNNNKCGPIAADWASQVEVSWPDTDR